VTGYAGTNYFEQARRARDQFVEHILSTVAEWAPGYTCPDDGPQERVRLIAADYAEGVLVFSVEPVSGPGDPVSYRVRADVEEHDS
jgi:hypothetical protein